MAERWFTSKILSIFRGAAGTSGAVNLARLSLFHTQGAADPLGHTALNDQLAAQTHPARS